MEQFEYKVIKAGEASAEGTLLFGDATTMERALNNLGQQGWELICVDEQANSIFYFFKRKKQ